MDHYNIEELTEEEIEEIKNLEDDSIGEGVFLQGLLTYGCLYNQETNTLVDSPPTLYTIPSL